MAYLRNLTSTDLHIPSLGVTIPAGAAVEIDDDPGGFTDHPLLKLTKTKPGKAATTAEEI